ncbi:hypothetical protein O181_033088 [Austropuccinia psidii MF-1]|uniref:Peptidyl-prolyl isomerase CWC27 n=1 Tax=Austropuccinia psidii MF-1 TaxID=1389203 RepID=A0A9Q3H643_9BASI|nr:hypothetical protein [Austropuccinia psidii MF-1]
MSFGGPSLFVTEPIPSGRVQLNTTHGLIEIELWPKETPLACRNFVQLCLEGYYDGLTFHRVVPGFIVQTGDPTGTGTGGESIYDEGVFNDEINARLKFTRRGLVAMANLGSPNTNSSQFFITLDRTEELQDKHTIFGSVVGDTIYNVLKLSQVEVDKNERPVHPPVIKSTEVTENPFPDIAPRITSAQRKEQAQARKVAKKEKLKEKMHAKHRALAKNKGLLSFADEENLTEPAEGKKSKKFKSAHDLDTSSQLSRQVMDQRPLLNDLNFSEPSKSSSSFSKPSSSVKVHGALHALVGRKSSDSVKMEKEDPKRVESRDTKSKTSEQDDKKLDATEQVKADIRKMENELKKISKRRDSDLDSEDDAKSPEKKPKKSKSAHDGYSLLQAERDRFKARGAVEKPGKSKKTDGEEVLSILDGFRKKLREAKPEWKDLKDSVRVDGYAGEVDPSQDGVLGDLDGDDEGWMTHELKFRKDATADLHKADEYSVVDPLAERKYTLDELEATKNKKKSSYSRQANSTDRTHRSRH